MNSILLPADLYAKFFVAAERRTSARHRAGPVIEAVAQPVAEVRPSASGTAATPRKPAAHRAWWTSLGLAPLARFDLDL